MDRYFFQPGDRVYHNFYCDEGTIVTQCTRDEKTGDLQDQLDPNSPFYTIQWDRGGVGFESQPSLHPVWVPKQPTLMVRALFKIDKPRWDQLSSMVRDPNFDIDQL